VTESEVKIGTKLGIAPEVFFNCKRPVRIKRLTPLFHIPKVKDLNKPERAPRANGGSESDGEGGQMSAAGGEGGAAEGEVGFYDLYTNADGAADTRY
jgi:hypothetical protein